MYRLGRPTTTKRPKKLYLFEALATVILAGGLLFAIFWLVIRQEKPASLKNSDSPLLSRVEAAETFTEVSEPTFSLRLPGTWKETSRNNDFRERSIKWDYQAKGGIGRWVRIYIDTIPPDYPVTYVMPVSADGDRIIPEGISDHCSSFTPGAMKPSTEGGYAPPTSEKIPSQWQGVKFYCDGAHPLYQRVGTSSREGVNTISVTGATSGRHKYFFVYDDAHYNPDYTLFTTILDSFQAK